MEARIASYELAEKMQSSAPAALDLTDATKSTHDLCGACSAETDHFARNCLTARRLIERGVRFVQIWSGMGGPADNWDDHAEIPKELPCIARSVDHPGLRRRWKICRSNGLNRRLTDLHGEVIAEIPA